MGFNLGGHGRLFYNPALSTLEQTTITPSTSIRTLQNTESFDRGGFGNYNLSWDYDISKNQSLSASARFGARNFGNEQDIAISSCGLW